MSKSNKSYKFQLCHVKMEPVKKTWFIHNESALTVSDNIMHYMLVITVGLQEVSNVNRSYLVDQGKCQEQSESMLAGILLHEHNLKCLQENKPRKHKLYVCI